MRRELEPLGGKVPVQDPNYTMTVEEPNYNQAGSITDGAWGCVMPDTGMPAPCNVVAFAANLGLFNSDYRVTWNTDRYRTTAQPQLDRSFIGADNRSGGGNLPEASGLRRVPTYYVSDQAYSWAAGFNSVAAQGQTQDEKKPKKPRKKIAQEVLRLKEDIHCDPTVAAQIDALIRKRNQQKASGRTPNEFGFMVNETDGKYSVTEIIEGNEIRLSGVIPLVNTVAKIHSHPGGQTYSDQDINSSDAFYERNRGGFVRYLIRDGSLQVYNPSNPVTAKGRNRVVDASDCPKEAKEKQ